MNIIYKYPNFANISFHAKDMGYINISQAITLKHKRLTFSLILREECGKVPKIKHKVDSVTKATEKATKLTLIL